MPAFQSLLQRDQPLPVVTQAGHLLAALCSDHTARDMVSLFSPPVTHCNWFRTHIHSVPDITHPVQQHNRSCQTADIDGHHRFLSCHRVHQADHCASTSSLIQCTHEQAAKDNPQMVFSMNETAISMADTSGRRSGYAVPQVQGSCVVQSGPLFLQRQTLHCTRKMLHCSRSCTAYALQG